PSLSHKERKALWRRIEKKYLPHIEYGEEYSFLEEGGFFMKQSHIFGSPFYYIDYTLAQVCAFSFFVESLKDYDKAFDHYLKFTSLGGTLPFKKILEEGKIPNPMNEGVISSLTPVLEDYLSKIDDFKY
ncbi:MAG: M3 family oligoendopeptidase, partial [Bacilli bacterium]|nr:M3 family oligoendopeptidase [Bacilli bacterium]